MQVTTKGAGLNPNAKVWQEVPAHQNDVPEGTEDSPWPQTNPPPAEMTNCYTDVPTIEGKGCDTEFPDGTGDFAPVVTEAPVPTEGPVATDGINPPDFGYLVFDQQSQPAMDGDVSKEQPMSEECLRESLKKQLEFCFSRENLSKDLYLISQMDSDQFVSIWTIACIDDIKALTTDMDLIVDVLRASPMVQVDESGEKVRPNHSRCIIILREVPETTPVEEVEALFKSENCPKALSAEFAHNSNWYITFQSDMDALQAFRYLREEVKMFQGKPIMARIKAINTFFGKNGFRSLDSSVFSQPAQPQAQYSSPVYMPQMYSPQQQYPVYPVVSQSWNPSVTPYFETPLAPFQNGGFMNGYNNPGNYKGNSGSIKPHRPMSRNQNHVKGHHRPADMPTHSPSSLTLGALMDGLTGPLSVQPSQTPEPVSLLSFTFKDIALPANISNGDLSGGGRGRRGGYRGMRRKREDEYTTHPIPLMEAKVPPPPKFDLAASNFPPLPGSVVSTRGETTPEMRLSDVVRGIKVTNKPVSQEANESRCTTVSEEPVSSPESVVSAAKPDPVALQTEAPPTSCDSSVKEEDKAEVPIPEEAISSSMEDVSPAESEYVPPDCSQSLPTEAPSPSPSTPTSELGLKKLSYAEVCQKMAKPGTQIPSPSPPASSPSQPLQELKANRVEEPCPNYRGTTDKPEKNGDSRPPRQPLRSFRGGNGQARVGGAAAGAGAGLKVREHQRGLNIGKPFNPQRGARRSGKEQNIPPRSPK
ncbi:la-related protein 4 isoform X2 [Platichthys flesus]|uniref:la-related protein 4 isoform X2 n=1 Tax=Platichthys flesus TaxID=8260 RepID=UPI002DB83C73|nr:la-related protein 4 isoform X2 [Platichthys flesus]